MNKKYKFITFEGIEGCGKSTQTKMLLEFFQKKKIPAILTREPGGTMVAEEIRNLLINGEIDKLDGTTEVLLNFAARRDHVRKLIKPSLADKKIVISDRFFDSTLAYQGFAGGVDLAVIEKIKSAAIADFEPNITFLIDLDVKVAMQRILKRDSNNRYEKMSLEFHQAVRTGFLEIAKANKKRFRVIDGSDSPSKIHKKILEILAG
jgi:dTMP kinase